jgi:tetratricopeptide (TPR) repeat protein
VSRILPYVFLAFSAVVPFVQGEIDRDLGAMVARGNTLYLRTGEQVRRLCPGFEGVMGGIYWLRAVQYYGGQRAYSADKQYENLAPLIEITNALDPRLELAYRYGALFLAEAWPAGAGKPEEGIRVLERGIRNLPDSWRLRWDLGSLYYFFLHDHERAAEVLLKAAEIEGAPFWLKNLAATMLGNAGDRATAREIWKAQYAQAGVDAIRDNALLHIQLLDALDLVDGLNDVCGRFSKRTGHAPTSPADLVAAGMIARVPADPTGVPFDYDPHGGRFSIAHGSKLWRPTYDK